MRLTREMFNNVVSRLFRFFGLAASLAFLAILPWPDDLQAGSATEPPALSGTSGGPPLKQRFTFSVSGAQDADISGDLGSGELGQIGTLARYNIAIPLSKDWFFRGGPTWQGYFFDSENLLIPEQLHEFVIDIGFGRRLNKEWTALAWISPGFASDLDALGFEDFNLTGVFGALWKPSDTFEFMIGARWAIHSNYPILPAAGFKWKFAPQWELSLMAPKPELSWSLSENLTLIVGAEIAGGSFRTGGDFGQESGRDDLSDEWLSFREICSFAAIKTKVWAGATLQFEAGWMIDREFEFIDQGDSMEVDGAFYGSAVLQMVF